MAEFLELANARTLEGSVGYLRFTVQPENLAVLESLADRLAPAPSVSRPWGCDSTQPYRASTTTLTSVLGARRV